MNMVENTSFFYFWLLLSGLFYPRLSAVCGFVWGTGRIVYAVGYISHPKRRVYGEFFYIAELVMIGAVMYKAWQIWKDTSETRKKHVA